MTDGRYATLRTRQKRSASGTLRHHQDKFITLASEVGTWDYTPDEVLEKGRVGPGELFVVDTSNGKIWTSFPKLMTISRAVTPTSSGWTKHCKRLVPFEQMDDASTGSREFPDDRLKTYQKLFGYSFEELDQVIRVLGENGQEAVGSMGTTPRWRCSPPASEPCTTTSARCSPR